MGMPPDRPERGPRRTESNGYDDSPMRRDAALTPLSREDAGAAPDGGGGVEPPFLTWVLGHASLVVVIAYVVLGVIFFWPGLLPGHTVSAADYLWNSAPWNTMVPHSIPTYSLSPLVRGSNPQLVDGITVFEPFLQYTRSQLPHLPLWDPYIMGGMPYLGDMQSAIFSPFSLPAYVLPFWWSLGVIALLKVVVAATGAYLLGRALKMGLAGAFVTGLVFGFGLFMIAWIPWPLTNVFPLIPWMLLATERLVHKPGVLPAGALAGLVALQFFGGEPESSVYAIAAVVGYFVLRLLQADGGSIVAVARGAGRGLRARLRAAAAAMPRPVIAFVLALGFGTAIAAIAILPFLELLRNSNDLAARPRSAVHVQSDYIFAAFLPGYFPGSFVIVSAFYAGALPLMLGIVALFRPRVERVAVAVVGVLSVLVVLGIQPFFGIAGRTPVLDLTYLSRLTIVYLLCLALLAGWGLDDLLRRRPSRRRARAEVSAALGLLLLPVVVVVATSGTSLRFLGRALDIAWLFQQAPLPNTLHELPIDRLAALIVWLTVAGAAVLLLALYFGGKTPRRLFAIFCIALVVGDLFQAGMGYSPAVPTSHAVQPATGAIRYLQRQRPARFVAVTPYDTANPLPPDVNIRYGLYDLRGYDLPVLTRFSELWKRYVAPPTPLLPEDTPSVPLTIQGSLLPSTMRILSLYGVRDILEGKHEPLNVPGLPVVYDGPDAKIYANPDALPRTWLVTGQTVVQTGGEALAAIGAANFDARREVITEHRLAGISSGPGAGSPGQARITQYTPQRVTITTRASRASLLILSDNDYPGWKVTVNGRTEPIHRVDFLLRGVAVPAGVDHVVFTYDSRTFRVAWMVSLAAAVVLGAAVASILWRRRRTVRRHAHSSSGSNDRGPRPVAEAAGGTLSSHASRAPPDPA